MKVAYGKFDTLPAEVKKLVEDFAAKTEATDVHVCDGSPEEAKLLTDMLVANGTLIKLEKYDNCYLSRTHPGDVARVESKTFMCTPNKSDSVPLPFDQSKGQLGNWCNDKEMMDKLEKILKGCMKGRRLYVIPFCMGPLGSPLSKIGIQLTDSAYVVINMRNMTSMGDQALKYLDPKTYIKCLHSVNCPLPLPAGADERLKSWPCNPDVTLITQFPLRNEIISVGSGYGGNSLLGKKCFALRLACNLALKEGWLAEHMLIMGVENDKKEKKYIAASFPSACGKTNLAMITSAIPGWKVTCVGDDIAWMRFDKDGVLRAVNPEKGFFGVAPGTSHSSNPVAMKCILKDTIFTNVGHTSDGGVFWEGLEAETDMNQPITDWLGNANWKASSGKPCAHPNSRFCAPIRNCPILDEHWDDPEGVPISAMIFGGRRPEGIPLVYESYSWEHGVLVGASLKSETTSAASDMKAKVITHDPFAMRPFMGYNGGRYIQHWFNMAKVPGRKLPKIYHVNWFLKDDKGNFMWPGFGENMRVVKWIFERCQGKHVGTKTAFGLVPKTDELYLDGLGDVEVSKLFDIPAGFVKSEVEDNDAYFKQYLNADYPPQLKDELEKLKQRV